MVVFQWVIIIIIIIIIIITDLYSRRYKGLECKGYEKIAIFEK